MPLFDEIIIVDWSSARNGPLRPRSPPKDRIYLASPGRAPVYHPSRVSAHHALRARAQAAVAGGRRLLIGLDVGFGLPEGTTKALTGEAEARSLWAWLTARVIDDPSGCHNLPDVVAALNEALPGEGPFWGAAARTRADILRQKPRRPAFARLRVTEQRLAGRPLSMWQLAYAGAVGAQSLLAMAALERLRGEMPSEVAIWPFDGSAKPVVIVELYLSLLPLPRSEAERSAVDVSHIETALGARLSMTDNTPARDPLQVAIAAATLARLDRQDGLGPLLDTPPADAPWREEGWVFGTGHEARLTALAAEVLGRGGRV